MLKHWGSAARPWSVLLRDSGGARSSTGQPGHFAASLHSEVGLAAPPFFAFPPWVERTATPAASQRSACVGDRSRAGLPGPDGRVSARSTPKGGAGYHSCNEMYLPILSNSRKFKRACETYSDVGKSNQSLTYMKIQMTSFLFGRKRLKGRSEKIEIALPKRKHCLF